MKSTNLGIMKLKPSEIFFLQDSISNKWGEQSFCRSKLVGETLDELLTEHIAVKDIPNITVVIKDGKFYTADNRRLWIFRKAEELGFVHAIEVDHVTRRHVKRKKFTSKNGGISIKSNIQVHTIHHTIITIRQFLMSGVIILFRSTVKLRIHY